jgi:hypothetical protein
MNEEQRSTKTLSITLFAISNLRTIYEVKDSREPSQMSENGLSVSLGNSFMASDANGEKK